MVLSSEATSLEDDGRMVVADNPERVLERANYCRQLPPITDPPLVIGGNSLQQTVSGTEHEGEQSPALEIA
ncbi:hypothetical protein SAMN05421752_104143 [Natronorubrum thiooxidans]|uniref:Uncharacterized protein n=1 Tax=Natronorubrum thiooxidans TaxID=308853 RepID=A0A1N7EIW9_9EURY|nr:hypothetical protein SAMN05421752_104143 [Natronorubrum thiooxidans]